MLMTEAVQYMMLTAESERERKNCVKVRMV